MKAVFLAGKIEDEFHLSEAGVEPLLRFHLFAKSHRQDRGLPVVMRGSRAEKYMPYLKIGQEIGVVGFLTLKNNGGKWTTEVDATRLIILGNHRSSIGRGRGQNE